MPDSSTPGHPPGSPGIPANPGGLKTPIADPLPALRQELAGKPVLWVGAGASVAAGYPTTTKILEELARQAGLTITPETTFTQVVDEFVKQRGEGALSEILQAQLSPQPGKGYQPTAIHQAIARLAKAGHFRAIVTTNYDSLLERALDDKDVPYVLQALEGNALVGGDGALRLLKLHGSREDWAKVILSGRSYQEFSRRYPILSAQLDLLLRQSPVLFVGCSLQDPRILDWLAALTEDASRVLKPWRALMTESEWKKATEAQWEGGHASGALARGDVRPLLVPGHDALPALWSQMAAELAPNLHRLDIEITVGAEGEPWTANLENCEAWQPADPLADPDLLKQLETLRALDHKALTTDERGNLSPEATGAVAALRDLAIQIGDRLTHTLLSSEARDVLRTAIRIGTGSEPPLLVLKVRSAGAGEEAEWRADRALALPWELLRLDERFPVEDGTLDLAREALVPKVEGLAPPDQPLSVVATVAAPIDATSLDSEGEMYQLWLALGREEKRLLATDLGTLEDLAREVERVHPPVIHFSGHGKPGVLLFEDEAALSDEVPVTRLVRRLRDAGPLPRLVYLSACHGATTDASGRQEPGERMVDSALLPKKEEQTRPSTAASLHRAGFPQVVAYFGPVGDLQATRAAARFYAALASGKKARSALREARRVSSEPHQENGRSTHVYPLGWAQLAFYHRGKDVPTVLPTRAGAAPVNLGKEKRQRTFDRLDHAGGSERVEGIRGVQRLRFGFVGRRKERAEAIRRWRHGERQIVVLGLGGLGKTTLCAEVAPILARDLKPGGARILAFDGRHAAAQPNPVLALWQELQAARPKDDADWNQTLADLQKEGLTGEALGKAAIALSELEGGLLVYLDDAESLQALLGAGEIGSFSHPELRTFWSTLLTAASAGGNFGLLASSRYLPEGTPPDAALYLPQLRPYEVVRLLSWMPTLGQLSVEDRARLAGEIDGHPRTIEYLEALAHEKVRTWPGGRYKGTKWRQETLEPVLPKTQGKVDADLLLGKVWEALPEDAQGQLGRCTVITEPAPLDAVLALEKTGGTTRRLIETGMLSPFHPPFGSEDWWAPHRLVSEMARQRWPGKPEEAHHRIGEWYNRKWEEEKQPVWAERAVRHLTAAGDGDAAWPAARILVIRLRNAGRYREALEWIERILAAAPTGAQLGLALAFKIQIGNNANVLPVDAEDLLLQAQKLVEPGDESFVLDELGKLARRKGELRKAADYLERSVQVETALKGEGHRDVALSLHTLAGVLQAQGDLDGARKNLQRSLQIQEQVFGTEIHPDVAASLHALAGVLQAQGDLDGARKSLEKVLEIEAVVYGTREHYSTAITEEALGFLLFQLGEHEAGAKLLAHAFSVYLKQLGPEHPYTRRLAELFGAQSS